MDRTSSYKVLNLVAIVAIRAGIGLSLASVATDTRPATYFATSFHTLTTLSALTTDPFTDIGAELIEVCCSQNAWGDYDNDGDLDLLLTGETAHSQYTVNTRLYRNDSGTLTEVATDLPGVSAAAWGDFDNDSDLDLLLAGYAGSEQIARIYRNDREAFTDISAGLVGIRDGAAAWGDYDSDGFLDIALCGCDNYGRGCVSTTSRIYRNKGDGTFSEIGAGLPGLSTGSLAWGDYDDDSDLDLLLAGYTDPGPVARIYRNDGGIFTDIGAGFPGVSGEAPVAWGGITTTTATSISYLQGIPVRGPSP